MEVQRSCGRRLDPVAAGYVAGAPGAGSSGTQESVRFDLWWRPKEATCEAVAAAHDLSHPVLHPPCRPALLLERFAKKFFPFSFSFFGRSLRSTKIRHQIATGGSVSSMRQ